MRKPVLFLGLLLIAACSGGGDPPSPVCTDGESRCVNTDVEVCVSGAWSPLGPCPSGATCEQGNCVAACTAECAGKECGDDGCGGDCGTCADSVCNTVTQQCETTCMPACTGRECGDDGCGGSCGACGAGEACNTSGMCEGCTADCTGKVCGDDGCGGSCGMCQQGQACNASGQCEACTADCTGRVCGDDGCGGSCGMCGAGEACNMAGQCECAPDCTGRVCGDDGCGGSCGMCQQGETCQMDGTCLAIPTGCNCTAMETCLDGICRDNGLLCNGTNPTGLCETGFNCLAGTCINSGAGCSATNPTGFCPAGQLCQNGTCSGYDDVLLCDDGNACTTDLFDPARNRCVHQAVTAACSDGNACTTDVCVAGACEGTLIGGCIEPPTVDPVVSPTNVGAVTLTGTKPSGSSIEINGMQAVAENPDTDWTVQINLSPGTNSYVIRSVDMGVMSETITVEIVFDITPPTTLATPGGGIFLNGVTITVATDEPAEVFYTTDGAEPDEFSPSFVSLKQFRIFDDTNLRLLARDLAGNWEAAVAEANFEITSHGSQWDSGPVLGGVLSHAGAAHIDGSVYVAGGTDGIAPQAGAARYEIATSAWTTITSLPDSRAQFPLVAVGARLFAIGGDDDGTPLNSVISIDPVAETVWSAETPMPSTRFGTMAVVVNGSVWVLGGKTNGGVVLNNVEVYDPVADTWDNAVAQMPRPRYAGGAVAYNGSIYVVGGEDTAGVPIAEVDIYDIASNTWSLGAAMTTPRSFLAAGLNINPGRITGGFTGVITAGGRDAAGLPSVLVEEYVIEDDVWRTRTPLDRGRHSAASVTLEQTAPLDEFETRIWMLGGQEATGLVDSTARYLAEQDYVRRLEDLPAPRFLHAAAAHDDQVYVFGGRGFVEETTAWRFDPETETFAVLPPLATVQNGLAVTTVGDRIYAIGGRDTFGNPVATMRAFDPADGMWHALTPITTARADAAVTVVDDEIWVIGGDNNGAQQTVEIYNIESNSWRPQTVLSAARTDAVAFTHDDIPYLVGGRNSAGDIVSTMIRFQNGSWSTFGQAVGVAGAVAAQVHDNRAVVFAGRDAAGDASDLSFTIDLNNGNVESRPSIIAPHEFAASAYLHGRIYVLGGNDTPANDPPGSLVVQKIEGRCFNGVIDGRESEADRGGGCINPRVEYSQSFSGTVPDTGVQCTAWNAFRAELTENYTRITMRGSRDTTGHICNGPAASTICNALNSGATTNVSCDGRTWRTGPCGGSTEVTTTGALCNCNSGSTLRPCIDSTSWGGINGTTCGATAQTMEVICE